MATIAQLSAESWWDREIVTPELRWLGDELCRRTGRPRVAAGSKGDEHHLRGAHRSQEWIQRSAYCNSRTYTVQSGLTATQLRHIAGFDFTPGNTAVMKQQTQRLIDAMRAGRLDEVREVYGTTDGERVTGWNNVENRYATSDSSHLWHWHISIDRRHCANRALMERIVAIALGVEEATFMAGLSDAQQLEMFKKVGALDARLRGSVRLEPETVTEWAADASAVEPNGIVQTLLEVRALARAAAGDSAEDIVAEVRAQGEQTRAAIANVDEQVVERLTTADVEDLAEILRNGMDPQRLAELGELLSAPAGG